MGSKKCLNVTLLSAQGLKDVCTFGTMSPYAKAWINPAEKQRTPVAVDAGCTPVWEHKISLPLLPNALEDGSLNLSIQVMSQGTTSDTIVGSANIPLNELLHSTNPNGLEFMACQLLRPSGRVQGLVNFSVEISDQLPQKSGEQSSPATLSTSKNPPSSEKSRDKLLQAFPSSSSATAEILTKSSSSPDLSIVRPRRLSAGKDALAAPNALGSGYGSTLPSPKSQESSRLAQESDSQKGHTIASDLLGPIRRANSSPASSSSTPGLSIPTAKGTPVVAPDLLDKLHPHVDYLHQQAAPDGRPSAVAKDTAPAQTFAHTMFGSLIGSILMGDAIASNTDIGSNPHGTLHGDPDPGGDHGGEPQP